MPERRSLQSRSNDAESSKADGWVVRTYVWVKTQKVSGALL